MKKAIGATAALLLAGSLSLAGCGRLADDDCDDGIGVVRQDQDGVLAVELAAAPAGKGGGRKASGRAAKKPHPGLKKKPARKTPPKAKPTRKGRGSGGHHGHDDGWDCD
ncbi:hypothetical protein ABT301_29320 [Streptomyces sp. NPDC000987]|uniref:hypothetical protein n=1 Tax=Streptomyces sp. NPDC000987 TaxID=3154374 RepID=UPI003322F4B1